MFRKILCYALAMGLAASMAQAGGEEMLNIKSFGAWIAYWDADVGVEEAIHYAPQLNALIYFAAYFDTDDTLFLPDELAEAKAAVSARIGAEQMPVTYLSIVNDLTLWDGRYAQKDAALLYRLLETPQSRSAHIRDIIRVALESGCDGIEIDYERLGGDFTLWAYFISFIQELHTVTTALHMPLRVLLEPSAPTESVDLPEGCEYVMMCYNLYGTHSGPGPKADEDFLLSMVEKMACVPIPHRYAMAVGGFDWSDMGIKQVTWQQAETLRAEGQFVAARDEASGTLYFDYVDEQGAKHTVWYADNKTLAIWESIVKTRSESNIDLWRLGGNL